MDFVQLEALPEIVEAVGDRIEVFLDGGVRSGTDVFKGLALGAKMVFVGRPICWGLFQNVMSVPFSLQLLCFEQMQFLFCREKRVQKPLLNCCVKSWML